MRFSSIVGGSIVLFTMGIATPTVAAPPPPNCSVRPAVLNWGKLKYATPNVPDEGSLLAEFTVHPDGTVSEPQVISSEITSARLKEALMSMLLASTFAPVRVACRTRFTLGFHTSD